MKPKTQSLIVMIIVVIFLSCKNDEDLDKFNSPPKIEYSSKSTKEWETLNKVKIDTAKINLPFSGKIRLRYKNYRSFKNVEIKGINRHENFKFRINDKKVDNDTTLIINKFNFSASSTEEGIKRFKIIATADFGKSNEVDFTLVFVPNKIPVGKSELTDSALIDPNKYTP